MTRALFKVTYVHLLFDHHRIIRSLGLLSESYFPGATECGGWQDETAREMALLFPDATLYASSETARAVQAVRYGAVLRAA